MPLSSSSAEPIGNATPESPLLSASTLQQANGPIGRGITNYLAVLFAISILSFLAIRHNAPSGAYHFSSTQTRHEISKKSSVVFAVIGDWGRKGRFGQREVARSLAAVLPTEASCIISVGDNFYNDGVTSVGDPQFNASFESVYSQPRIERLPWYVALGNHDHQGSVQSQILYSHVSSRWNMPARYFAHWLSSNLLAIFLDTTPLSSTWSGEKARKDRDTNPDRQLAWLTATLATAPATTRFVIIGHHNMYSMSVADHYGTLSVRDVVEPLLHPYSDRIVGYIAGHEHALMHMQPYGSRYPGGANIDHFVSGAGSKLRAVVPASSTRADYWRNCCGVLAISSNQSVPRTLWGRAVNGYFVFRLEENKFSATAFDIAGEAIYQYQKSFPIL